MLTIRWTLDEQGRLVATFVRPEPSRMPRVTAPRRRALVALPHTPKPKNTHTDSGEAPSTSQESAPAADSPEEPSLRGLARGVVTYAEHNGEQAPARRAQQPAPFFCAASWVDSAAAAASALAHQNAAPTKLAKQKGDFPPCKSSLTESFLG